MTRKQNIMVVALAAFLAAAGVATQANDAVAQTPRPVAAPIVALIGCVERVMPTAPAGNPATPAPPPVYKIMDVQPGSAPGQKPMTLAREYRIVGPESITFSKFQNQWVEVTGSITAAPAGPPPPATGQGTPAPQLSTFTVTALKVVSTECRGGAAGR